MHGIPVRRIPGLSDCVLRLACTIVPSFKAFKDNVLLLADGCAGGHTDAFKFRPPGGRRRVAARPASQSVGRREGVLQRRSGTLLGFIRISLRRPPSAASVLIERRLSARLSSV